MRQAPLTAYGFSKTFVLPAFLIFLVPILSFFFFIHAQSLSDSRFQDSVLKQIQADPNLSAEQKSQAREFFRRVPLSQMLRDSEAASSFDMETRLSYGVFHWMIVLSALSILGSFCIFVMAGICVWFSLRSQSAQYFSLLASWHVLRFFGAFQCIVLGLLCVALSFWVTALWFERISLKLILTVAVMAVIAVALVIRAIFKSPKTEFGVTGAVLTKESHEALWNELTAICAKVGAQPPDQVIAGIDDSFFVTEHPVTVAKGVLKGKTLFVSLALLKHLDRTEADAVLAHEMAHFSGDDTVYAAKISPLLSRYQEYLQSLHASALTMPVFYFMNCFRALFQLSLSRLSRQRERRADQLAADVTSPRAIAGALVRVAAYSRFRQSVENELFKHETALESANVSARIDEGFPAYAVAFAGKKESGTIETPHPFDSHPPLQERLTARGFTGDVAEFQDLLANPANGGWRAFIPEAEQIEQEHWKTFEEIFRLQHERSLPYRFLPANEEERAVVVKDFPELTFLHAKKGDLTFDFEKMRHSSWPDPVYYREITNCQTDNSKVLTIHFQRGGKQKRKFATTPYQEDALGAFQHYYHRYLMAAQYQKSKSEPTQKN